MKKIVSGVMLFLILIITLTITLAFTNQPTKADWTGTVYIRADGSIDPPGAPVETFDNVTYKLTGNITSINDGIVIERDNIILDGANFTVQGKKTLDSKGIFLSKRYNVTIKFLNIADFYDGIFIDQSSYDTIFWNNLQNNVHDGVYMKKSAHNIFAENVITRGGGAIYLSYSHNNKITANNLALNNGGISISQSNQNNISINYLENNGWGIELFGSSNNTLSKNNIFLHTISAITIEDGLHNIVYENNITDNYYGITIGDSARVNIICKNDIKNNTYGIYISDSSENLISVNNLTKNYYGIICYYASQNIFYHNNIEDNTYQARIIHSENKWDNGYSSGGNYWSDYTGVDLYCGPYQNETGSDGIGDTPYVIDEYNMDRYPLINPWPSIHEVSIINVTFSTINPKVNDTIYIYVVVQNLGHFTETFDVSINYTRLIDPLIGTQTVTLNPDETITLTFTWTPTTAGRYEIKAYTSEIPDDMNLEDNTLITYIYVGSTGSGGVGGGSRFIRVLM